MVWCVAEWGLTYALDFGFTIQLGQNLDFDQNEHISEMLMESDESLSLLASLMILLCCYSVEFLINYHNNTYTLPKGS